VALPDRLRIIISGMIAGDPWQGGATWAVLQYILGLRNLGHEVYFVEPIAQESIRPKGARLADSANARYLEQIARRFNLSGHAAVLQRGTRETVGMEYHQLVETAATANLLVNISGMLTDPSVVLDIPTRVYLDLDPAFNQLWHTVEGIDVRFGGHTHFVTIGTAIGTFACTVPTCGRRWLTTLQPIVLNEWPSTSGNPDGAWTTVANWRGYGSIHYRGVLYGQKAHSLRQFLSLPRRTKERFLLALAIHPDEAKDLASLSENGWSLVDPAEVTASPDAYQAFIQASKAELGIAKSGYVAAQCGWFSDRSVCYLASGRPVLAQDTGLAGILPAGEGLITFSTEDEAVDGIGAISRDYWRHARAARAIAEEYFDSDRVLTRLLTMVGAC
jgi:hypothetical protein